ncbi:MAG: glycoside hydrolase family 3 N-terminal domain-containing protein [Candidatus Paceibacterota bacterium]|jgi:beta-N-acetylhexosaminidase
MNFSFHKSFILALCILSVVFTCFPSQIVHGQTKNYEKLFYIVDGKNGLESFKKNIKLIDIIAPQSYTVHADLTISGSVSNEIKNIAKVNNIKIIPLIVNAGFSQKIIHDIVTASNATQNRIIDFMINEAQKNNYSGWQFDFEHISYTDRDAYSNFVEKTYSIFGKNNLSLSIAAVARINDDKTDFYKNWSGAFDYERLAKTLDFISIMTYDDPNSKGPAASMPFVEDVYVYLRDKIPPDKLSLGVPFYYWGWSVDPFKRVRSGGTYERLEYLRSAFKVVEGFDMNLKVPYLKYVTEGKEYVVWHEDGRSFVEKMNFMKRNNLRGFSAWVLGLENPGIWNVIKRDLTSPIIDQNRSEIQTKIKEMTLEEKIGQIFLVGIFTNDSNAILEKLITDKKIGSVILMNQNIRNKKVLDITRRLQNIASSTHQPPLLISIDQEGGIVSRITDTDSNLTSEPEIKDSTQAYNVALARGKELYAKGINVNFAPVLEYITNPSSFLYHRVFRGSKENVTAYGENMVRGYQDAGIAATVKHFPGHDDISVDSHKNLPISTVDKKGLPEYMSIFKAVIEKGKPMMVMTAHVLFTKIDPVYPATLSPIFIKILREDYGYEGIIITDDMNMGAITKSFGIKESAVQAIKAGNDILLYVASVETINTAYQSVLNAVRDGHISEERIDSSVYRVLNLKEKLQ